MDELDRSRIPGSTARLLIARAFFFLAKRKALVSLLWNEAHILLLIFLVMEKDLRDKCVFFILSTIEYLLPCNLKCCELV